jgi:hypothetical protein
VPRSLHPCGYRNPLTGDAECDLPARLYLFPDGSESWMCDGHAFAIEDLLRPVR